MDPVTSIVIVGGGSAGWITAGTLAARLKTERERNSYKVTLVESPNTPIIGVGEGTWPTMRSTLRKMGVRETDFIKACSASFKQGAKFVNWHKGDGDVYYHPLMLPQAYFEQNLAPHWPDLAGNLSFSEAVCPQDFLCEQGLAPKLITTPEYGHVANYAYHLDAGAFAEFLKNHCVEKLGVNHILDDVVAVKSKEDGDIQSVISQNAGEILGDLFIDCTGFRSLLLGGHYDVPFKSCKEVLFIDTALAVQLPYEDNNAPIASHTISTAQNAGWIWDIGLQNRRGVGHVYSSDHLSEDKAVSNLKDYVGQTHPEAAAEDYRKIDINPGHRTQFWKRNCVAVGMAAGFLEPLEASALLLIEISANMIAEQLPANRFAMEVVSKRFNETFLYRWERIIDFLKLHYIASERTDHSFWKDNRKKETIPDSLLELMDFWKYQSPWHDDFDRAVEVFPAASYQYVLYGMGFKTEVNPLGYSDAARNAAMQAFEENAKMAKDLLRKLPSNRELLDKITTHGLQRV